MAANKPTSHTGSTEIVGAENRCHVCNKEVNRKHQCAKCWKCACENHSVKRRFDGAEKPQKVCDVCDAALMKEEIRVEMQAEIEALERELETARTQNSQLTEENLERAKELNLLEHECKEVERVTREAEGELKQKYTEEQIASANARAEMDKLTETLKKLQDEEKALSEECQSFESRLAQLRVERQDLMVRKETMTKTLSDLETKVRGSVPISQLEAIACEKCREKLRRVDRRGALDMVYEESEDRTSTNLEDDRKAPSESDSQS